MFPPLNITQKRLIFGLAVILFLGITASFWLLPRVLALYHQVRGGIILANTIQTVQKGNSNAFACDLSPVKGEPERAQLRTAIAYLEAAKYYNPRLAQTYLLLGRGYCLYGEQDNAINAYLAYIQLRPQNPLGHLELGFAYETLSEGNLAKDEWKIGGLTEKDFRTQMNEAIQANQFNEQQKWYRRWLQTETQGVDSFSNPQDPQSLMVFESFIDTDSWHPCPWCNNVAGDFSTQAGVLSMSYQNLVGYRDWFAYLSNPNINIHTFTELDLRIKGKPGTFLTVETVIDHLRSRPISYQPLPVEWTTWTIPIHGDVLNDILIGIPEFTSADSPVIYQLSVDWIALK